MHVIIIYDLFYICLIFCRPDGSNQNAVTAAYYAITIYDETSLPFIGVCPLADGKTAVRTAVHASAWREQN